VRVITVSDLRAQIQRLLIRARQTGEWRTIP